MKGKKLKLKCKKAGLSKRLKAERKKPEQELKQSIFYPQLCQ